MAACSGCGIHGLRKTVGIQIAVGGRPEEDAEVGRLGNGLAREPSQYRNERPPVSCRLLVVTDAVAVRVGVIVGIVREEVERLGAGRNLLRRGIHIVGVREAVAVAVQGDRRIIGKSVEDQWGRCNLLCRGVGIPGVREAIAVGIHRGGRVLGKGVQGVDHAVAIQVGRGRGGGPAAAAGQSQGGRGDHYAKHQGKLFHGGLPRSGSVLSGGFSELL
jgi:hypothetical protein